MPARKNGPKAGPVLGTKWDKFKIGQRLSYGGTRNGCKANVYRANKLYADLGMKFISYKKDGKVYVERVE